MYRKPRYVFQVISYIIAIMATVIYLPHAVAVYRPCIFLLCMYAWALRPEPALPIIIIWLLGLLLDLTTGSLFGQHAMLLVIIAYALQEMRPRLRLYGMWQHGIIMLALGSFYILLQSWLMVNISAVNISMHYFPMLITTILLWAVVYIKFKSDGSA